MTTTQVVIIGAGGFGREVLDVLKSWADGEATVGHKVEFLGFLDDGEPVIDRLERLGAPFLGPVSTLEAMDRDIRYVIGIGSGEARRKIDEYATGRLGLGPLTVTHSTATIGADVRVGVGAVICAGVRITTNVTLGRHVHLNLNSTVGHDAVLGDYVTVNPLVAVSGDVQLAPTVTMGTGSTINQGRKVGRGSMIGAGASVVKDIPAGVTAVGVPAIPR